MSDEAQGTTPEDVPPNEQAGLPDEALDPAVGGVLLPDGTPASPRNDPPIFVL